MSESRTTGLMAGAEFLLCTVYNATNQVRICSVDAAALCLRLQSRVLDLCFVVLDLCVVVLDLCFVVLSWKKSKKKRVISMVKVFHDSYITKPLDHTRGK